MQESRRLSRHRIRGDVRDANLRGFGLRVLPSGRKRYFIHTQFKGQRIWKLIGDADQTNLADARESARAVLAAVRKGLPAVASSDETRFETVAEEAFRSQSRHWKPSTLKVNRWYLNNQILPWFRGRQIADITRKDVQDWFMSLHATPVAADRSAPVLSVIMTQAEVFGHRPAGTNPCRGIRRYRRKGRERFLSEAELRRLGEVLSLHATERQWPTDIITLLLLTGCRASEIRTLQWRDFRGRTPAPPRQQDRPSDRVAVDAVPGRAGRTAKDIPLGFSVSADTRPSFEDRRRKPLVFACVPTQG